MNAIDFINSITLQTALPIYVVNGEDVVLRQKVVEKLQSLIAEDYKTFNSIVFESVSSLDEIYNALQQLPVFSDKIMVIVKELVKYNDNDKKFLEQYYKNPNPMCVLVVVDAESAIKAKNIEYVDCSKLSTGSLVSYLTNFFNKRNVAIEQKAIEKIVLFCDNNLQKINNEAEKLCLFTNNITCEIVDNNITPDINNSIFAFTNALADKNNDEALAILQVLLQRGESEGFILALISAQYRKMFYCATSNQENDDIAKAIGVSPKAVYVVKKIANKYSVKALKFIMDKMYEVELGFKSGEYVVSTALVIAISNIIVANRR
ncbi:MAG: DNA polymerase III subunit delta [Clostridia bacterium]